MNEIIFPDRRIARRHAPVPDVSSETPKAPLKPAQPLTESQSKQPTTSARRCSRCGKEPRAGSSGWGKKCIAAKMREVRAARASRVNNAEGALVNGLATETELTSTQRKIEEARRRLLARRSQETSAR
jgi:hypothetical protein